MEILNKEYLRGLIEHSKQSLNQIFDFPNFNFSRFDSVNSFLIDKVLNLDRTNILITTPTKDRVNDFILPTVIITALHCLKKNGNEEIAFEIDDIILSKQDGRISTVKEISETQIRILPLGTIRRIDLDSQKKYIQISQKYADRLEEVRYSKARIKKFESKKFEQAKEYNTIISLLKSNDVVLPLKNKNKVVIVGSKNEILPKIPSCIPFQYVNKSGEVYPDTPFDPLLIVVNDFNTTKEFLIDKSGKSALN